MLTKKCDQNLICISAAERHRDTEPSVTVTERTPESPDPGDVLCYVPVQ